MAEDNFCEIDFSEREKRIIDLSDRILAKLELAVENVNHSIIKLKEKQKTVEYDADLKKPVFEEVKENETVEIIESVIDVAALKQIVATLKDIKDINTGFKNNESEDDEETGVILISEIEHYCKEEDGEDE